MLQRRNMLASIATTTAAVVMLGHNPAALAADGSATTVANTVAAMSPKVTDRVFLNVRISRQDGTFYVRDDLPDTPENNVFYGRLVLELFGEVAPATVERFKSYITSATSQVLDDNPLPSYSRATFPAVDPATGVLAAGKIPGLELTTVVGGATALQYGGRLLPAPLWVERGGGTASNTKLSHVGKGLLTHKVLESLPVFGITTRTDTTQLDPTHIVFGRLVLSSDSNKDDDDGAKFLQIVSTLPTYSERSRPITAESGVGPGVDEVAQAVFAAQRSFFRSTAKSFGDSRLEKVYDGKLLRRVEVTQAGIL